jgi:hypothetical protein
MSTMTELTGGMGSSEKLYAVGDVAALLGRASRTIRRLEAEGVLFTAGRIKGRRRYTAAEFERIRMAAEACDYVATGDHERMRTLLGLPTAPPAPVPLRPPPGPATGVEPWQDIEDDEEATVFDLDGYRHDRQGQPILQGVPRCPGCGRPVHTASVRNEPVWTCPQHGLVEHPSMGRPPTVASGWPASNPYEIS